LTTCKNNKEVVQYLDLKGLYKQTVRKKWQKISGQPYQCKILDVPLNLTSSDKEPLHFAKATFPGFSAVAWLP
jgi:hypothetical protein